VSNRDLEIYFSYLRDVLYYPKRAGIELLELSDEDHREFAEAVLSFGEMVIETRELAGNLSRGELDVKLPNQDNELAAPLKALHSTLKHLTWQAKQVADGDYDQRVGFMGDFSISFNEMISQLAERRRQTEIEAQRNLAHMEELAKANSIFQAITSSMEEWIVMINRNTGELLFENHPTEDVLASNSFEKQFFNILFEFAVSMTNDDEPRKEEFSLISDTALQYFEMMLYPIRWFDHDAVACVITDVTVSKEEYHRLEDAAYKDELTGVFNRLYGMKLLESFSLGKKAFYLIFVDMDMLKYVNDVFGHSEGDEYIRSVARILQNISTEASVCRLGGDEFMVLIQKSEMGGRDIYKTLEDLREKLAASSSVKEDGKPAYLRSMSFGIVEVGETNTLNRSDILSIADERMYEYKRAHKKERQV